jgi:hypothetical protein
MRLRSRVTMRYGAFMDLFGYDLDNVADCSEFAIRPKGLYGHVPRDCSAKRAGWRAG